MFCFIYLFIFIGVQLLCNVVQQCESAISVHISPPSWPFLPPNSTPHPSRSSQRTELSSLHRFPLAFSFAHCTMNYHLTPVRRAIIKRQKNLKPINAGEDVEKMEPSCTVGGTINRYSYFGEQYGGSLKNQNYHMTQKTHSWAYTQRKL